MCKKKRHKGSHIIVYDANGMRNIKSDYYYGLPDESGNNQETYRWDGDAVMNWYGQEVTHWMPLPQKPIISITN